MRRLLLVAGAALLLSAYPFRVHAFDEAVELEASPYGGSASGQFQPSEAAGCATWAPPAARVRYGGVGVTLRVREVPRAIAAQPVPAEPSVAVANAEPPPEPEPPSWKRQGFIFEASGALEGQKYENLVPATGQTQPTDNTPPMMFSASNVPGPLIQGAFHATFGGDWRYFGGSAGVLLMTNVGGVDIRGCSASTGAQTTCVTYPVELTAFPDLRVRIGPFYPFHVDLGLGSYNILTLPHPGLYIGGAAGTDSGWEVALHFGRHANFQGPFRDHDWGRRGDVGLKVPIAPSLRLGANGALYEGFDRNVAYGGALSVEIGLGRINSP